VSYTKELSQLEIPEYIRIAEEEFSMDKEIISIKWLRKINECVTMTRSDLFQGQRSYMRDKDVFVVQFLNIDKERKFKLKKRIFLNCPNLGHL
jgi:hypothetical protein